MSSDRLSSSATLLKGCEGVAMESTAPPGRLNEIQAQIKALFYWLAKVYAILCAFFAWLELMSSRCVGQKGAHCLFAEAIGCVKGRASKDT